MFFKGGIWIPGTNDLFAFFAKMLVDGAAARNGIVSAYGFTKMYPGVHTTSLEQV